MNVLQHTRNELNQCLKKNRPDRPYRDTLLRYASVVNINVITPDKCFPFTFDEKEKWHFFLVEEDFVYEHLCFFFADYAEAVKFFKSVDN